MRLLVIAAACCWLTPAVAQNATDVLSVAEAAYKRVQTLRAEFTQTIDNPMFGDPETSHGVLYLSPPDRFSMRFDDPEGDRVVADGKWLWLFTPSSIPDQVIRTAIPESGPATPNLFAQFVDRPLERYTATYVGEGELNGREVDKVKLVPRVEDVPFQEAVISVTRGEGMLRALDLIEESGQRRVLVFDRIETNIEIPRGELRFDPPAGVRIVKP